MDRTAFCPGHITGFFEVCMSEDILSTGSRGAGLCLSLGATSRVTIEESEEQGISVQIAGSGSKGEVTLEAVRELIGPRRLAVDIRTTLDLPMRQGFGMSAAGSLSAALAVADALGLPRQKAFEAAHVAEVRCGGGLGDVSAIYGGGAEIRIRAGLPPKGEVVRIGGAPDLVLAVVGRGMRTKNVLGDPAKVRAINASGARKVDELMAERTVERFMGLSREFASETGLASKEVMEAIEAASGAGMASMSMLGDSVFAVGNVPALREALSRFGETWVCKVDTVGPRTMLPES